MIRYFPDVRSGLTGTEDSASEPDFDALLAGAVEKTRAGREQQAAPAERREAPVDPSRDDAGSIRSAVTSEESASPRVEDGLTDGSETVREGPHGESRELRQSLRSAGIDPDAPISGPSARERALEQELANATEALQWQSAEDALLDALDDLDDAEEPAEVLAELVLNTPDDLRGEIATQFLSALRDEHGYSPEELHEIAGLARQQVEHEHARSLDAVVEMTRVLEERKADEMAATLAKSHDLVATAYFMERGVGRAEALDRLANAYYVASEHGVDLQSLPPEEYLRGFARFDGEAEALKSAQRQYRFKQQMMSTETTNVAEGLGSYVNGDWVPDLPTKIQPKRITSEDIERHSSKVNRRRGTFSPGEGLQIKEALTAPDPKAGGRDGWDAIQRLGGELFDAAEAELRRNSRRF